MFRFISPVAVFSLLVLSSTSPLLAESASPSDAFPGADLFQKGRAYDQGLGTPINYPEAIRLYGQAAAAGNPMAKASLALVYFNGNGVPVDKNQAAKWAKDTF